jgi:hypothetical protein
MIIMNKEQHTGTAIAVVKKKKVMLGIVAVLGICACGISGYAIYNDDRPVEPTNLPAGITEFVTQFFPGRQITAAEIDFMDYEIWLDDNTHVEFEWNRKWEQIESYECSVFQEHYFQPVSQFDFIAMPFSINFAYAGFLKVLVQVINSFFGQQIQYISRQVISAYLIPLETPELYFYAAFQKDIITVPFFGCITDFLAFELSGNKFLYLTGQSIDTNRPVIIG